MVGASVFYDTPSTTTTTPAKTASDLETLDSELRDGEKAAKSPANSGLSSYVWICTSTHKESRWVGG